MATTATESMKIVCDRTALVDSLTMASSVVMSRTTVPVLMCVKLSARDGTLRLWATDQDIRLSLVLASVEVHTDGDALIPADKLAQIVRSCDDTTLTIEMDKNVDMTHANFLAKAIKPMRQLNLKSALDRFAA
jgi:DNA polymerase III subunit beta